MCWASWLVAPFGTAARSLCADCVGLFPAALCCCDVLLLLLQLTLPTRSTNMSFIKLTTQNKIPAEQVYEVRGGSEAGE